MTLEWVYGLDETIAVCDSCLGAFHTSSDKIVSEGNLIICTDCKKGVRPKQEKIRIVKDMKGIDDNIVNVIQCSKCGSYYDTSCNEDFVITGAEDIVCCECWSR